VAAGRPRSVGGRSAVGRPGDGSCGGPDRRPSRRRKIIAPCFLRSKRRFSAAGRDAGELSLPDASPTVRGPSHHRPLATRPTGPNARVFAGRGAPRPVAAGMVGSL